MEKKYTDFLTYLTSADTSQKYLKKCYQNNNHSDAEKKSYDNSYRFLYYLEHGQTYFKTGDEANIVVTPILYFYGIVHLLKACLLTVRPDYPENTAVLAHGVSTRKRKKQQYSFLQDEVKMQHKGLFPYLSTHLFGINQFPSDKVDMNKLLAVIPELQDLFIQHRGNGHLDKVGHQNNHELQFPDSLLDNYHMTHNSFITYISKYVTKIKKSMHHEQIITVQLAESLRPDSFGPFYYHLDQQSFYFPNSRHYFSSNHELMNHYLLLYNLSMICRYETEWWGELTHMLPTEDYPFIKQFLSITSSKVHYLIGYFLYQQKEAGNKKTV